MKKLCLLMLLFIGCETYNPIEVKPEKNMIKLHLVFKPDTLLYFNNACWHRYISNVSIQWDSI